MNEAPPTGYEHLASTRAGCVDELCDRFEESWRTGQRPAIEPFLREIPEPEQPVVLRELILLDLAYRRRAGDTPHSDDYRSRFPALEEAWLALALAAPTVLATPRLGVAPPPASVPGFEILGELGLGGMGVVCKARDTRLGRFVALKFLPAQSAVDPRHLERFRREARAAGALNHPAVCTLHDIGEHEGRPFLVLEWVEGQTLRALASTHPDLARLLPLLWQVAQALQVAHTACIVHRDIKPENLMVRPDGYIKVLDFGLARLIPTRDGAGPAISVTATDPGGLIGTVRYMSPEQARRESVGSASDIFSLGLVLYELATGRHPFETESDHEMLHAICSQPPLPPALLNPEISASLEVLTLRMLEKDPRRRPTAAEVEATLGELLGPKTARRAAAPFRPVRPPTVGRGPEREALRVAFESITAGRGCILCLTGEPGIGKTTLVEDFLQEMSAGDRTFLSGRGRCSERLAGSEAYLPVLEALEGLLRGEGAEAAAGALRTLAPTWYAQVAPTGIGERQPVLPPSQERLKRELLAFLEELTRWEPVVLFLDDVHWADPSTVDLLAYLGDRCAGLRLLVLLTYRPTELLLGPHPFLPVQRELQRRGICHELLLDFLSHSETASYLALAFPRHRFSMEFADLVHNQTEGNPLFLVDLLSHLRDHGVIVEQPGGWVLARAVPDFQRELPESVRSLIQRKIAQLEDADRRLLSAAAVQGYEFDSAVAARVLGRDAANVEERLEILDRVYGLVRRRRELEFPDGTLTLRYQFVHVLYQNALYAGLQPSRRAATSAAVAQALLDLHGGQSAAVAGAVAVLFEAARDWERAAATFCQAAANAARVCANQEAMALARRGLALLQKLPDTPGRAHQELALLIALGVSLIATKGFASPDVEKTYLRARALCQETADLPALFPVLCGLWNVYLVRCDLVKCKDLAVQTFALAQDRAEPVFLLVAHNMIQQPLFHLGDLAAARRHQEQGLALYDSHKHGSLTAVYGEDPGVGCLVYSAATLWHLGYPEQALRAVQTSRSLAEVLSHPFCMAQTLYYGAFTHLGRREARRALELSGALRELCREHGFTLLLAGGMILHGCSLTALGRMAEGIEQMQQGLADWQATGALSHRPYQLSLLAEALEREGQVHEGLTAIGEALAMSSATGECFWEAELHRLRGELLLKRTPTGTASPNAAGSARTRGEARPPEQAEAEACFRRAIAIALQQGAKSLELRAVMSLARFLRDQGQPTEGKQLVAETLRWFTEGGDTADLQDAKAFLEEVP